jgi:hypothetical protein
MLTKTEVRQKMTMDIEILNFTAIPSGSIDRLHAKIKGQTNMATQTATFCKFL